MAELITPAEYARRRKESGKAGGSAAAVWKAINSGRITTFDGKIDPKVADIQWEENTRKRADLHSDAAAAEPAPVAPSQPAAKADPTWADSKARTEAAVAALKELELGQRRGELIDRAGYELAAQKTGRMLRDALVDTLPAKIAVELAALSDPWGIECRLRDAIRAELVALSADLRDAAAQSRLARQ